MFKAEYLIADDPNLEAIYVTTPGAKASLIEVIGDNHDPNIDLDEVIQVFMPSHKTVGGIRAVIIRKEI